MNRRRFLLGATALTVVGIPAAEKAAEWFIEGKDLEWITVPFNRQDPADFTTDNLIFKATERYRVDWKSFQAIAVCDRCGVLWSRKALIAMVSPVTRETTLLVCRECHASGSQELSPFGRFGCVPSAGTRCA